MRKITVQTIYGAVEWGMNELKILTGTRYEMRHAIMSSIMQYMAQEENTEFAQEEVGHMGVWVDEMPLAIRETLLVRIDPYYHFANETKLSQHSALGMYATQMLVDMPYSDEYATLHTAYEMMADHVDDALRVVHDEIEMKFGLVPFTPKLLQKFVVPQIHKQTHHANAYVLTMHESIRLQCKIAHKVAKKSAKHTLVLYEGYVDDEILVALREIGTDGAYVHCLVNAPYVQDVQCLSEYIICGCAGVIDCADDLMIREQIMMNMPYNGTFEEACADVCGGIAGNYDHKNAYLKDIL